MERLPTLLDVTTVADHLGVTVRHVRRLVAERRIPYLKWGHLLRFDPDRIAAWLCDQEVPTEPGKSGSCSSCRRRLGPTVTGAPVHNGAPESGARLARVAQVR